MVTVKKAVTMLAYSAVAATAQTVPETRQQELVRMVRQDCGSCHGMHLTGGLGPELTRQAMAPRPVAALQAVIYYGRPGTPMPGWKSMLNEAEARWIAEQLRTGFPQEQRREP
ncbi:MAG: cytochrome c [Hylemonella sp.]|nr:cytochrome c [Hylemonella sp.]